MSTPPNDAVMTALDIVCDQGGLSISPKRVTISTVGVVPGIVRLADQRRGYSLAVSLHASTPAERLRRFIEEKAARPDVIVHALSLGEPDPDLAVHLDEFPPRGVNAYYRRPGRGPEGVEIIVGQPDVYPGDATFLCRTLDEYVTLAIEHDLQLGWADDLALAMQKGRA